MYKVVKFFTDLKDNNFAYCEGDKYPRDGLVVSDERIAELAGSENRQGQPLIELVADTTKTATKKRGAKKTADI